MKELYAWKEIYKGIGLMACALQASANTETTTKLGVTPETAVETKRTLKQSQMIGNSCFCR